MIEEIILANAVKLKLPASIRIYLMVNISQIVEYREIMKKQKVK